MGFPQILNPAAPAGLDSPRLGDDELRAIRQFLADLFGFPVSPSTISAAMGSVSTSGKITITNGLWNGDVHGVAYGGTGFASYAVGDLLQASASGTLAKLSAVAIGNAVISGGVGVVSSWGKIGLTTHVSGDLPFANFVPATAASKLVGRGAAAGAGDFEEITIGTGLTMSGTTLSSASPTAATVTTDEGTLSATYTDLTTAGPSVTVTIGSSGLATVWMSCGSYDPAGATLQRSFIAVVLSGTNTRAAADADAIIIRPAILATGHSRAGVTLHLSGLTAGSTTFKMQYRTEGAGSVNVQFHDRHLAVLAW